MSHTLRIDILLGDLCCIKEKYILFVFSQYNGWLER